MSLSFCLVTVTFIMYLYHLISIDLQSSRSCNSLRCKSLQNRINIQTATDDDVTDYIQFKIWQYNNDNSVDSALWDFFQEDFEEFVMDTFSKASTRTLKNLFLLLRKGGVYVRKNDKRAKLTQVLADVLLEETQHKWSQEEFVEAYEKQSDGTFKSNVLTNVFIRGLKHKTPQNLIPQSIPGSTLTTTLPTS